MAISLSRSDFKVIKHLSAEKAGGMNEGIVLVRERRTGSKYIEKRVDNHAIRAGYARREIKAMALCFHRNICSIIAHDLDTRGYGYGSIYMECCELGSLDNVIKKSAYQRCELPEGFLWKVLWDISLAICYLQTGVDASSKAQRGKCLDKCDRKRSWNPIVHRDIKPANLFLTWRDAPAQYPTLVLGDFGCSITSTDMSDTIMSAFTRAFQPPEAPRFSDASDIYSLALSVHCMAQLREVPSRDSERVRRDPLGAARYSDALDGVLRRYLKRDYTQRPDCMYLPYLVWREIGVSKGQVEDYARATRDLPEWVLG